MILIEPEVIERLKINNIDKASTQNLSRLDEEMHKVMKNKLDDREKWTLYLQTLQRYLYFVGKDRKPLEIPITTFDETDHINKDEMKSEQLTDDKETPKKTPDKSYDVSDYYTKSRMLQLIPQSYKIKGELLLDILMKNKNKIYWNDKGTVFIDNKEIVKSNIVDLLSDTIRPLKNSSPAGWAEFALALHDLRVPLSYIGNPRRATYIKVLSNSPIFNKGVKTDSTPTEPLNIPEHSTPLSSQTTDRRKINKKIDWQKWTPY